MPDVIVIVPGEAGENRTGPELLPVTLVKFVMVVLLPEANCTFCGAATVNVPMVLLLFSTNVPVALPARVTVP